jgi:dipeptidyl aminopeptidase/acylaminoacyl peptidase
LLGLGRQPEEWSLGIAGVPLADLAAHYEQQSTPPQAYWRALFGGTPADIADTLRQISPIEFADAVSASVLVLAGDNDPRCPSARS